jgi:hypothetical protein
MLTDKLKAQMYKKFNNNKTIKLIKRMTPRRKMYALVINIASDFP